MHQQVERGQEALLLVGELLVERPAGHARQTDHLLDARALIAALRHRLDHRAMDTRALMEDHLAAVEPMGTVWQTLVKRRHPGCPCVSSSTPRALGNRRSNSRFHSLSRFDLSLQAIGLPGAWGRQIIPCQRFFVYRQPFRSLG